METTPRAGSKPHLQGPDETFSPGPQALLDRRAVCALLGGTRPINPSTLYRGIREGRFPKQIRVGGSSRWLRNEIEAVLRGLMDGRAR
jgi:predicted DNA-binding transcriptional regulator AlpA